MTEQGLSRVVRFGSTLHQECGGEGFGLQWTHDSFIASAGYFRNKGGPLHAVVDEARNC